MTESNEKPTFMRPMFQGYGREPDRQLARIVRKSFEARPEDPKEGEDPLAVALRFAKRPELLSRSIAHSKEGRENKAGYWLRRAMGLKA